ncbi:hypothetical protein ACFLXQ_08500 [Chloroflexota bacterium]
MERQWEHRLPPLIIFSFMAFVIGLLMIIPDEDWLSLLVYFVVLGVFARVLYKRGIEPADPTFPSSLFLLALILKLGGSAIRYWTGVGLYGGLADAVRYHEDGQYFAGFFRQFDFSVLDTIPQGTEGMSYLAGLLYTILPPNLPGSYFFFATLAFTGSVFYYRAFLTAFPKSNSSLFRFIIFFLPSVLFWPSSLGKDAWIFFSSSFVAYGLTQYIRQTRLSGLLVAGIGIFFVGIIRPPVAAIITLAVVIAYLVQGMRTAKQFVGGVLIVSFGFFIYQFSTEYLLQSKGLPEVSWAGLQDFYQYQQQQTHAGGSRFAPIVLQTLLGPIYAVVTVLFRPFVWEANNSQVLVTAFEGILWLGLFWYRRKVFLTRIRLITKDPWIAFLVVYSIFMILSLTTIANFGLLARQRLMFLPFLWMLFV